MPKGMLADWTGVRFGKLVGIRREDLQSGKTAWRFRCDCGNEILEKKSGRVSSDIGIRSCGCDKSRGWTNIIGERFGKLICIEKSQSNQAGDRKVYGLYNCVCDCGGRVSGVRKADLLRDKYSSCGCDNLDHPLTSRRKRKFSKLTSGSVLTKEVSKKVTAYVARVNLFKFECDLTTREVAELLLSDCYYCNGSPEDVGDTKKLNGIDRVDPDRGYTRDNVVPCCWTCNTMKMGQQLNEFKDAVARVYSHTVQPPSWQSAHPGGFEVCY